MSRHFRNNFKDYETGDERVFEEKKEKIVELIRKYVELIVENTKPRKNERNRRGDLYVGDAGIAFMFTKLHQFDPNLVRNALELGKLYIESAKKNLSSKPCAFLCGNAGIFAVSAVVNHLNGQKSAEKADIDTYLESLPKCLDPKFGDDDNTGDEFLVGRAGFLSGMYYINEEIDENCIENDKILELCNFMLNSGRNFSSEQQLDIPLMYQWHGKKYLGAAHGISAILFTLLRSSWFSKSTENDEFSNISHTKLADIKNSIDYLLRFQAADGNFPTKFDSDDKHLVHWCHGSPGFIILYAKAYLVFKEKSYLEACVRCADNIWHQGLLLKGPGICHGIAGNGYAFLLMFRLTNNPKYLHRAHKFAEFLETDDFKRHSRTPDRPFSLFEGIAGTVCFLIDLMTPEKAAFPFMNVF
ncbi:lanC-like protein 3 homolog [Culicoides brevitarsis]|uniref:lanC-like protein 3 homolog n=1 Tax=Culicoides brevitarsis TaxID=469753 RepID=UPI00307B30FC